MTEESKLKIVIKNLDQAGFEEWEKQMPKIKDTTVVVFPSILLAFHMAACFVQKDLIPRVGSKEEAIKFPIIRKHPSRDGCEVMDEILGLKKPRINEETYLCNREFEI